MPGPAALERRRLLARVRAGSFAPAPPSWFVDLAADRQDGTPGSALESYRTALAVRRRLQTFEELSWVEGTPEGVVPFTRPGGWTCLTNSGPDPVPLPAGRVVLRSGELGRDVVPADTTVWLEDESGRPSA